jgi:hypothetical protein
MSILDANVRTNNEHDFYQTLPCQIKCLCQYLDLTDQRVLDAGSGKQVISNQLRKSFPEARIETSEVNSSNPETDVITFDFETMGTTFHDKFPEATHGDFLNLNRKYDYIISNPPYSLKDEFIEHALELSKHVFMLFPLQILNYIEVCEKWLDDDRYCGRILMYPKVILNAEGEYIQGGNTGYAWFHWSSDYLLVGNPKLKYEVIEDIRKYK